jgi:hypothetical protein
VLWRLFALTLDGFDSFYVKLLTVVVRCLLEAKASTAWGWHCPKDVYLHLMILGILGQVVVGPPQET